MDKSLVQAIAFFGIVEGNGSNVVSRIGVNPKGNVVFQGNRRLGWQ